MLEELLLLLFLRAGGSRKRDFFNVHAAIQFNPKAARSSSIQLKSFSKEEGGGLDPAFILLFVLRQYSQ